jgi:hypothetical protein
VKKFTLFVEDDLAQVRIWEFVCKKEGLSDSDFAIVSDGAEAISFLERSVLPRSLDPKPSLVITDLRGCQTLMASNS